MSLSEGIANIPHGLTVLSLDGALNSKGVSAVVRALQGNVLLAATLQELSLANNKFDEDANNTFLSFITFISA